MEDEPITTMELVVNKYPFLPRYPTAEEIWFEAINLGYEGRRFGNKKLTPYQILSTKYDALGNKIRTHVACAEKLAISRQVYNGYHSRLIVILRERLKEKFDNELR